MIPCRTEKVDFSQKIYKQKHNQKQNHQKNNSTGRVTRKKQQKEPEKKKHTLRKKNVLLSPWCLTNIPIEISFLINLPAAIVGSLCLKISYTPAVFVISIGKVMNTH